MELNQYLFSDYINEKIIKMSRFKQLSNSPSAIGQPNSLTLNSCHRSGWSECSNNLQIFDSVY